MSMGRSSCGPRPQERGTRKQEGEKGRGTSSTGRVFGLSFLFPLFFILFSLSYFLVPMSYLLGRSVPREALRRPVARQATRARRRSARRGRGGRGGATPCATATAGGASALPPRDGRSRV